MESLNGPIMASVSNVVNAKKFSNKNMKYVKYLKYVLRHKWYVMIECFRFGLIWRGIMHDMSKLRPSEFIPYANFFYGNGNDIRSRRDKSGYYKPTDTGDKEFDFAWLFHQKRNSHHWQWWVLPEDGGGLKVLEMSDVAILEMVCDWLGAGKAQGKFSPKNDKFKETRAWYSVNKEKMQLHPKTRRIVEYIIKF